MPENQGGQDFDLLDEITKLPQSVKGFILSSEPSRVNSKIFEKYKISEEARSKIMALENLVFVQRLDIPNFLEQMQEITKNQDVGKMLVGWLFLPLNDFFGGTPEKALISLGEDLNKFSKVRIQAKTVTSDEVVQAVMGATNLKLADELLKNRLHQILESFIRSERDKTETEGALTRSTKVGGLALDKETAKNILDALEKNMQDVLILSKKETKNLEVAQVSTTIEDKEISNKETPKIQPLSQAKTTPSPIALEAPKPVLEALRVVPQKILPIPPAPTSLIGSINPISSISPINPIGPISPIGDQKESPQPSSVETPASPKPFSVVASESSKLSTLLPKPFVLPIKPIIPISPTHPVGGPDLLAKEEKDELKKIKEPVPPQTADTKKIIAASVAHVYEVSVLNFDDPVMKTRFESIVTNRLKDIRDGLETKELFLRAGNLGGMGMSKEVAEKISKVLDEEFSRTHDELRAAKGVEIQALEKKRVEEDGKKQEEARKKAEDGIESKWKSLTTKKDEKRKEEKSISPIDPIRTKTETSAPPLPYATPNLEDIKYKPKLVGPIEELKNFLPEDLRKLAVRPQDAAQKILEKISVLQSEAYEKRIAGIVALKTSPLWNLYTVIVGEALIHGKNPKDIIAIRKSKNAETLSEEEFNAIMELSQKLRF